MRSLLVRLTRMAIPWVIRILGWMANLAVISAVSIWVGVPQAVARITEGWVEDARKLGIPPEYEWLVFYPSTLIAIAALLLGWVIIAFITVIVVNLIFFT